MQTSQQESLPNLSKADKGSIVELARAALTIHQCGSTPDMANSLDSEGMMDHIYSLIASGVNVGSIATKLGISTNLLKAILNSSNKRMRKFKAAQMSSLADDSIIMLGTFKDKSFLLKEEAAAARHHINVVTSSSALLEKENEDDGSSGMILNMNLIYKDNKPPPLPDGLDEIIIEDT